MRSSIYSLILLSMLLIFSCSEDDEMVDVSELSSPTPTNTDQFTDSRDGNVYRSVKIGDQVWMAENLRYLPRVIGADSGSFSYPYFYVYGYNGRDVEAAKASSNYKRYGVLYNWPAAIMGAPVIGEIPDRIQGICPDGWHLPSDAEWTKLTDFLGGRDVAGGKIKLTDTTLWKAPNDGATNESRFSALPAGFRQGNGTFADLYSSAYWWSSTDNGGPNAWFRNVYYANPQVYRIDFFKNAGFCVRCIKD